MCIRDSSQQVANTTSVSKRTDARPSAHTLCTHSKRRAPPAPTRSPNNLHCASTPAGVDVAPATSPREAPMVARRPPNGEHQPSDATSERVRIARPPNGEHQPSDATSERVRIARPPKRWRLGRQKGRRRRNVSRERKPSISRDDRSRDGADDATSGRERTRLASPGVNAARAAPLRRALYLSGLSPSLARSALASAISGSMGAMLPSGFFCFSDLADSLGRSSFCRFSFLVSRSGGGLAERLCLRRPPPPRSSRSSRSRRLSVCETNPESATASTRTSTIRKKSLFTNNNPCDENLLITVTNRAMKISC
eukprot:4896540-Pyramimonas_sp.AAC.1